MLRAELGQGVSEHLREALMKNDLEAMQRFLTHQPADEINALLFENHHYDSRRYPLIIYAVKAANIDMVQLILACDKVDVNARDSEGLTALHTLLMKEPADDKQDLIYSQILALLLAKSDINCVLNNGLSILDCAMLASKFSHRSLRNKTFEVLLKSAAFATLSPELLRSFSEKHDPISIFTKFPFSTEMLDFVFSLPGMQEKYIPIGADNQTLLKMAIAETCDVRVVQSLIDFPGADINAGCDDDGGILFYALKNGRHNKIVNFMAILTLLINHPDVDLTKEDSHQNTILTFIADSCTAEIATKIVRLLKSVPGFNFKMKSSKGITPLMTAALLGVVTKIETFLNLVDINEVDAEGNTALHYAVQSDNKAAVTKLIGARGIDLNVPDAEGFTPLLLAANNDLLMCEYLLDKEVDVKPVDKDGNTVLLSCLQILKKSHRAHSRLNWVPQYTRGKSVELLTTENILNIIRKFAHKGGDLNHENNAGETALSIVMGSSDIKYETVDGRHVGTDRYKPIFELLIDRGVNLNFIHRDNRSSLAVAIREGRPHYFQFLADKGADINHISAGKSLLEEAIQCQYSGIANFILSAPTLDLHGQSTSTILAALNVATRLLRLNARSGESPQIYTQIASDIIDHPTFDINENANHEVNFTPLMVLVTNNFPDLAIKLLGKEGIIVNSCNSNVIRAPILTAIREKQEGVVRALLNSVYSPALDLDVCLPRSQTNLLMVAIWNYTPGIFSLVFERSRHLLHHVDAQQRSALHYAACFKNTADVITALLDAGIQLNAVDSVKMSALHYVVISNCIELATQLLQAGIQVALRDTSGRTARELAQEKGFHDIATLISGYEIRNTYQDRLDAIGFGNDPSHSAMIEYFVDPITGDIMEDPITVSSGITYDRDSLVKYFRSKGNPPFIDCPTTRNKISRQDLSAKTNVTIKKWIDRFVCQQEALYQALQAEIAAAAIPAGPALPIFPPVVETIAPADNVVWESSMLSPSLMRALGPDSPLEVSSPKSQRVEGEFSAFGNEFAEGESLFATIAPASPQNIAVAVQNAEDDLIQVVPLANAASATTNQVTMADIQPLAVFSLFSERPPLPPYIPQDTPGVVPVDNDQPSLYETIAPASPRSH